MAKRVLAIAAIAIVLVGVPFVVTGNYALRLVDLGLVSIVVVLGLNFISGYCGQINFAQAAFWGIGGYVTAIATLHGWPFWLALPASAAFTAACTLLLGLPTLRLRAYYLAMATIGFGEIVQLVLVHWDAVTGGSSGLRGVPAIVLFGVKLDEPRTQYGFLVAWCVVAFVVALCVRHSKLGRAMIALRDSEIGAEAMGVDTVRVKMLAFVLSSIYASVGGSLYVATIGYVSPDLFTNARAVLFFVMLVIGGSGSALGAVLGTVVLTILPEALRFLRDWYLVFYGTLVVAMIAVLPGGLASIGGLFGRGRAQDRSPLPMSTPRAAPAPRRGASSTPVLVARDVTQRFGGLVALDRVSVDVAKGTVHAVIGPNGSGKTTFLNVLSGAYRANEGSVALDGVQLIGSRPSAIARAGLSRTFQNIRLYRSLTVVENVMVGAACHARLDPFRVVARTGRMRAEERALRAAALQALETVGLAALAERSAGGLAYAQQRLVEIARAIAAKPSVLLLDEPAAGMNPQEAEALTRTIRALSDAGLTIVFVEHNVRLVMSVSDRISVFDFGRKIAEGTPDEIRSDPAVIEAYLGRPRERRAPRATAEATDG